MKKKAYLFDSHALLAFFQKEKGHQKIMALLEEIRLYKLNKFISIINLGELIYSVKRRFGDHLKIEILSHIYRMGFEILPVDNNLILDAAELKGERALSYADCIATVTARRINAVVVTGDPEFKEVEGLVDIFWTRP